MSTINLSRKRGVVAVGKAVTFRRNCTFIPVLSAFGMVLYCSLCTRTVRRAYVQEGI